MSSHLVRKIVLGGLLIAAAFSARFAVAGAASMEAVLEGGMAPSASPALLGPITEAGRTGWACAPERAAAAKHTREAELPAETDQP
ncbi:MAG: hypothetical protein ACXWNK_16430 [Vulcanimicrobiaceae bacterium]